MEQFNSVEAVLKRAIQLEEEAMTLYSNAAQSVKDDAVRQRLEEMAAQERGHKAKLEDVLSGNVRWAIRRSKAEPVTDLRLSDHLVGGSLDPNADYQDVLLFAARREKAAHDFYKAMGEMIEDKLTQNLFEMLAQEELRHKYVLEKTYEEVVYKDF
jgi:rubrerythrin